MPGRKVAALVFIFALLFAFPCAFAARGEAAGASTAAEGSIRNTFEWGNIITGGIAVLSLVISLTQKRHEIKASSITMQRIQWIKEVRELCAQFLIEFNEKTPDPSKLEKLEIRIKLYGRSENIGLTDDYIALFGAMDQCLTDVKENRLTEEIKRDDQSKMLAASQDMLHSVWVQMKREAGIRKWHDRRSEREHGLRR